MDTFPIPPPTDQERPQAPAAVRSLIGSAGEEHASRCAILDWRKVEFVVERPSQQLPEVAARDPDTLTAWESPCSTAETRQAT